LDQLLDLYGFVSVVLRVAELAARTVLLGGVAFWALLLPPLARRLAAAGDAGRLHAIARRTVLVGAAATLLAKLMGGGLGLLALAATLESPAAAVFGADFVTALAAALLAVAALGLLALPRGAPGPGRRAALLLAALAVIAASAAGSHAIARTEERPMLLAATALHQTGAALWVGGLPSLLAALRLRPETAATVGRRYSAFAAAGVGLILLGAGGFWLGYIGEAEAVYGTAYGAMAGTKAAVLGLMLLLGLGNFLLLHRVGGTVAALPRVRRFVEAEAALALAALALAASLTSVPPAADLPEDRVSWADIAERFTPAPPRFSSPSHGDLAIPALQARLDTEWRARTEARSARPEAFTPGEGLLPPRNAGDIAWSEYNHHWSGLLVLLVGFAALLDSTGKVPIARHWPLLFLLLAVFIGVRADPEAWPLGEIGLLDSLRDPEVVQHKLAALLVAGFALAEWAVRLGRIRGRLRFVFPVAMLAGGVLLLSHTHAIANVREALLVELAHLPIAVLAVVGGGARWTELRGPPELARAAAAIWPACLVVIGVLLLIYREA
jgi:putative copper resistance protein D